MGDLQVEYITCMFYDDREYANVLGNEIVSRWCPLAWRAFLDYRLNAMTLSARKIAFLNHDGAHIRKLLGEDEYLSWWARNDPADPAAQNIKALYPWLCGKRNRERDEFEAKLEQLGLPVPWKTAQEEKKGAI